MALAADAGVDASAAKPATPTTTAWPRILDLSIGYPLDVTRHGTASGAGDKKFRTTTRGTLDGVWGCFAAFCWCVRGTVTDIFESQSFIVKSNSDQPPMGADNRRCGSLRLAYALPQAADTDHRLYRRRVLARQGVANRDDRAGVNHHRQAIRARQAREAAAAPASGKDAGAQDAGDAADVVLGLGR